MDSISVISSTQTNDALSRRAWVAYLRQELTAPAAALTQYTHDLARIISPLHDDYLEQATQRMVNRAEHLQTTIQQLVEAPTTESQRGVRHDLRAAASYIVSACDDIAESVADDRRDDIASTLSETRSAAHQVIDSIEELLQFGESSATLPTADGNLVAEMLERLPKLMERHPQPIESSRILIVDDNEFGRDLLARMLSQQGHAVEVVASAMEAQYRLGDASACTIDLILLDVLMPGMSGPELLHWLKREPSFWHLPVIMVSALGEDDSVLGLHRCGCGRLFNKARASGTVACPHHGMPGKEAFARSGSGVSSPHRGVGTGDLSPRQWFKNGKRPGRFARRIMSASVCCSPTLSASRRSVNGTAINPNRWLNCCNSKLKSLRKP